MKVDSIDRFTGGWFIGDFEPALLKTKHFEVAQKVHRRDELIEPHLHSIVTEYNLVVQGEMTVNGKRLSKGDLFIMEPGDVVNATVETEEVTVICVKVPSIPSDKTVVKK